jgi:hypothetical protein
MRLPCSRDPVELGLADHLLVPSGNRRPAAAGTLRSIAHFVGSPGFRCY